MLKRSEVPPSKVLPNLALHLTVRFAARRASRDKFDGVLARIPKGPPIAGDEIPPAYLKRLHKKGGLTNRRLVRPQE
jgi:hypothetical protein